MHAFHDEVLKQQARYTDGKDGGWTVILEENLILLNL